MQGVAGVVVGNEPVIDAEARDIVYKKKFFISQILDLQNKQFLRPERQFKDLSSYTLHKGTYIIITAEGRKDLQQIQFKIALVNVDKNDQDEVVIEVLKQTTYVTYMDCEKRLNYILRSISIPDNTKHSVASAYITYDDREIENLLKGSNDLVAK